MPATPANSRARLEHLLARPARETPVQQAQRLEELLALYADVVSQDPHLAYRLRLGFLQELEGLPQADLTEALGCFLADEIQPDDLAGLVWKTPEQVSAYCETLYSLEVHEPERAERVENLVRRLLNDALLQFEREGENEKLFTLLQHAPATPLMQDRELRRLRNHAYVYEIRRVQRHRRLLYAYLILQVFLVTVVFPWLFVYTENGAIQAGVAKATQTNLPQEGQHFASYWDGLYWSIITASSIGYGDVIPHTHAGRIIASVLGVMGVITVGVIAGLILQWINPRPLD